MSSLIRSPDVLIVGQDAEILDDLLEQLAVLVRQSLLFQIDQLAQGHAQDRVGLDGVRA